MRLSFSLLSCTSAVLGVRAGIPVIPSLAEKIPVKAARNSRQAPLRELAFNSLIYLRIFGLKRPLGRANRKNSRLNSRQTGKPGLAQPLTPALSPQAGRGRGGLTERAKTSRMPAG